MENKINLVITTIHSKKKNKDYKCLQLSIGEWKTLIFPRSGFEWSYIEPIVKGEK